ncbi:MAG: hypothetical protein AAF728_11750 [Cyanobacteria bacterium P01_D01_bin.128]
MNPAIPVSGSQAGSLQSSSELYTKNILGPSWFELYDLRAEGSAGTPVPPVIVGPSQSPYVIASNEKFTMSLKVRFNKSPLTALLLCLKSEVTINFHYEGFGGKAVEIDLSETIYTEKDVYEYTVEIETTPDQAGLNAGLYELAATAQVGPGKNECAQHVFGYGYIQEFLIQVYEAV